MMQLRRIGNEAGDNYFFELDGLGLVVTETGFDGLRRVSRSFASSAVGSASIGYWIFAIFSLASCQALALMI